MHHKGRNGLSFVALVNFEPRHLQALRPATERAHLLYKDILAQFEPPPLDPAIAEELAAFVSRRKEEGGAVDA